MRQRCILAPTNGARMCRDAPLERGFQAERPRLALSAGWPGAAAVAAILHAGSWGLRLLALLLLLLRLLRQVSGGRLRLCLLHDDVTATVFV